LLAVLTPAAVLCGGASGLDRTSAAAASNATASCSAAAHLLAARCDGRSDATHALQAALVTCTKAGEALVLPTGRACRSFPLTLPSHAWLQLPAGATLQAAGPLSRWPNCTWPSTSFGDPSHTCRPNATGAAAVPFLSTLPGARNLTIAGPGTIDGSGAQWWTPATMVATARGGDGNHGPPRRPYLLHMPSSTGVLLEDFLMLNGPAWHADLGGSDYQIFRVTLRTNPDWINTDGLDIHATNVHVKGVDITNGDDSICIKSPAWNVLVEGSIVRQGNGLVVGTSDPVDIANITFRNCTAVRTSFGCHIKFKDSQNGRPPRDSDPP
jgi:polygalacturonase